MQLKPGGAVILKYPNPNPKFCHILIFEMTKLLIDQTGWMGFEFFKVKILQTVGLVLDIGLIRVSSGDCIS